MLWHSSRFVCDVFVNIVEGQRQLDILSLEDVFGQISLSFCHIEPAMIVSIE